jgi:mono/diheme cytochrome c family protein
MTYPVRSDPVILMSKLPASVTGKEMVEPDRPGQLPLLTVSDMLDDRNPFYTVYQNKDISSWYVDPRALREDDSQELFDVLEEVCGTPAHPKVELMTRETRQLLQLDEVTLKEGSRLYRQYCLQCHGLTGDGRGPTARWLNPHPRDYRPGIFKFESVNQSDTKRPPRREDLYRTIHEGVEGTAMQSYNMLSSNEINAIVSYVIHLSIRGEVEEAFFKACELDEQGKLVPPKGGVTLFVKGKRNSGGKVASVIERWRESQDEDKKIVPGDYKISESDKAAFDKSIQNGYDIFVGRGAVKGGCTDCHFDFGRKAMFKFDDWATLVRPRDLTKSVYRGGRRPIDLYYRIHSGISGGNMPAQGTNLTKEQIWDVVNFVRVLPYPAMRKDLKPPID